MKIAYGSDLHLEFLNSFVDVKNFINEKKPAENIDVLVIAGDLHNGYVNILNTLKYISNCYNVFVVYVPGNHEYYESSINRLDDILFEERFDSDHYKILLHGNESLSIGNLFFTGGVGWIDGSYRNIDAFNYKRFYNDFNYISDFNEISGIIGKKTHDNIYDCLSKTDIRMKSIVITHFLPSPRCISRKYITNHLNPCFVNDYSDIIFIKKPDLWFYGHTHDPNYFKICNTKLFCNPADYGIKNLKKFDWRVIDI